MNFRLRAAAITALFLLPFASRPAAAQYVVTDLGADLHVLALNNQGQIIASVKSNTDDLYLVNGPARKLLGTYKSTALLNDAGQAAWVDTNNSLQFYSNNFITQLDTAGVLKGINNNGSVIWNSTSAYLYSKGKKQDLGAAYNLVSINNKDELLGYAPNQSNTSSYLYQNGSWRLVYTDGKLRNLTDNDKAFVFTSQAGVYYSVVSVNRFDFNANRIDHTNPFEITSSGQINSFSTNAKGDYVFVYLGNSYGPRQSAAIGYIKGKSVHLIPDRPPFSAIDRGPFGDVRTINNRGQVLFYYTEPTTIFTLKDVLYDPDSNVFTDVSTITQPLGIGGVPFCLNDAGQIVVYNGSSDHTYLLTPSGSVRGKVTLEGIAANAAAQNITFEFRDATDYPLFTRMTSIGADGNYTVSGVQAGIYHVRVKGDKYLAQMVNVTSTGGAVTGADVFLPAGDANNDNVVDIADFGLLVNAYGGSAGVAGSGYDASADFDGNGVVDISDFGLLVNNYNSTGAP